MKTIDFISNDLKEKILIAMASGNCSTINELEEQFGLTMYQSIQLMQDTQFMVCVANYSKTQAKLFLHSKGFSKLRNIAEYGNDKSAMSAIKMIAEYTGDLSRKSNVDVNISLEQQIRQEESKSVNPIDVEYEKIIKVKEIPTALNARPEEVFNLDEINSNHLKTEKEIVTPYKWEELINQEDFEFVN
jgi:hypothetical protein